jgi:hypothetical protein
VATVTSGGGSVAAPSALAAPRLHETQIRTTGNKQSGSKTRLPKDKLRRAVAGTPLSSVARLIAIAISHVFWNLYPPFSINPGRRILNNRSTNFRIDNALEIEISRRRKFAPCRAWTFVYSNISNENCGNRWTGRPEETGSGLYASS